jgi:hypothetical protein
MLADDTRSYSMSHFTKSAGLSNRRFPVFWTSWPPSCAARWRWNFSHQDRLGGTRKQVLKEHCQISNAIAAQDARPATVHPLPSPADAPSDDGRAQRTVDAPASSGSLTGVEVVDIYVGAG